MKTIGVQEVLPSEIDDWGRDKWGRMEVTIDIG
jgi:hypothetical protein